jgi:hypothetical protein
MALVVPQMAIGTPSDNPMNTERAKDYHSHAEFCSQQSQSTENCEVKKYWDNLAGGWLLLEDTELQSISPGNLKKSSQ